MGYKVVDIMENQTGAALVSEVLSIPLLIRGQSDTPMMKGTTFQSLLWGSKTISERLGLPLLTKSDGKAKLMQGTIFGRFGLPELLK